jgi:4-hydroxybenzoyl-CoA thioesterase
VAAPAPFTADKLIRFHHCDPAGIVFYPQYFVLINELVEDWFAQGLGNDFARLHGEQKRGVPVRRLECDFLSPSRIGEYLTFTLALRKIGGSSLTAKVEAAAGGVVRVRATLVLVYFSLETHRPVRLPDELRAKLARFVA